MHVQMFMDVDTLQKLLECTAAHHSTDESTVANEHYAINETSLTRSQYAHARMALLR